MLDSTSNISLKIKCKPTKYEPNWLGPHTAKMTNFKTALNKKKTKTMRQSEFNWPNVRSSTKSYFMTPKSLASCLITQPHQENPSKESEGWQSLISGTG